ncbi:RloB domain-containing protein [Devosia rhizoryzae]|uniref:RloB domain-containing protein n=1 Tax=Devosia rhizoryzae TaxID=2774137 RepID=A0ABX7CAY1_9HYPH|nr:RloB domain-containing protein [Devosia rhizoryzae]QQR39912.1 RloB domain-containing protein [Devosia rhizoryzae]
MRRRRSFHSKSERDTLLILSQDTGGAFEYLRQSFDKKVLNNDLVVSVQGTGHMSQTMLSDARRALAGTSRGYPHSVYVMLVVDRDDDPGLSAVVNAALQSKDIEVFVSVPCIEYYFMLHFGNDRPSMNSFSDLLPYLRVYPGFAKYSKNRTAVPIALMSELSATARTNATLVRTGCEQDGATGPRSDLDLLYDALDTASVSGLQGLRASRSIRDLSRFK